MMMWTKYDDDDDDDDDDDVDVEHLCVLAQAVLDAFKTEDIDSFQPDATFMDAMKRIVQDKVTDDLSLPLNISWHNISWHCR